MYLMILLPVFVSAVGLLVIIRTGAFFVIHPIRCARDASRALKRRGNASALTLALAGTLGVGNVFGVAMGIILGGAGSIFWLLLSSLFSMAIKYAEVLLSYGGERGGIVSVIRDSSKGLGAFFAYLYTALCLALAFVMGSSLQARSFAGAVEGGVGTDKLLIAPILTLFVLTCVLGGIEKIEKITAKIIPLTSIIYIIMLFLIITRNFSRLPAVIGEIMANAFSLRSAGSGALSFAFLRALREGYSRGVMSNEAGVGTSSFAHTRGSFETREEAGLLGIVEVFFDTVVVCGATGLAILLAVPDRTAYTSGMSLVLDAFSCLGDSSVLLVLFCVCSFAVSSVLCWYFYGDECRSYLFGKRLRKAYTAIFAVFLVIGVFAPDGICVRLSDTVLLFMSLPTLYAIIKHRKELSSPKTKNMTGLSH